jgi:hypothetical protein
MLFSAFLLKFSLNIKCTEIQWNYGRVVMDQEEALKRLQKTRKENEEAYLKAKAFLDGFRARGQLNQKDSEFLFLMEFVIKGFKNHGNDIITAFENQVRFTEAFNNLQLKVNDIEHEINQLKKTLDKMYQDR